MTLSPIVPVRRIVRPVTPAPSVDGSQIPERTICLVTDIKRIGNRRKVSTGHVEVDADKEVISVSKVLLDAPQWLDIVNHDTKIRRYLGAHCLPSFLRGGVFLLPIVSVEQVDTKLGELATERERLIERFMDVYPELVALARLRLRRLFQETDYLQPAAVRASFSFTWRYVTFRVPDTLAAIDREIFTREREKAAAQWNEAAVAIQALLRTHMAELVGHMTDRLEPGPDGKPKVFKNTLVSNLAEFLRGFDARNVIDDQELARVVERARVLLQDADPDALRRSQDVRQNLHQGFSDIKRHLDGMITNRPARRIVLDRSGHGEQQTASSGTAPVVDVAGEPESRVREMSAPTSAQNLQVAVRA